jgi:HIV Tat-specific factor 1
MDEALVKQQAEIYKVAGVDDDAPALDPVKKRKADQEDVSAAASRLSRPAPPRPVPSTAAITDAAAALQSEPNKKAKAGASASGAANAKPKSDAPRQSRAIFVSGLPDDVEVEEVKRTFRLYGIIAESVDDDEKRIKLYTDKDGNFKGEALIIYVRPESVPLAIEMMDGAMFPRDPGLPTRCIAVSEADFSYKRPKQGTAKDDTGVDDRNAPSTKDRASKAKSLKKAEEMNNRLADWGDDDVSIVRQTSSRADKVVVLKHIFTLQELAKDENLPYDIVEDMNEEAASFGDVKNVTIFDQEEDGVVTIRFSNALAAKACAAAFDGRGYMGRRLAATISTGDERFKKSFKKASDKAADEAKRLEEYSKYIEGEGQAGP